MKNKLKEKLLELKERPRLLVGIAFIIIALVGTFWYGGDTESSHGWSVEQNESKGAELDNKNLEGDNNTSLSNSGADNNSSSGSSSSAGTSSGLSNAGAGNNSSSSSSNNAGTSSNNSSSSSNNVGVSSNNSSGSSSNAGTGSDNSSSSSNNTVANNNNSSSSSNNTGTSSNNSSSSSNNTGTSSNNSSSSSNNTGTSSSNSSSSSNNTGTSSSNSGSSSSSTGTSSNNSSSNSSNNQTKATPKPTQKEVTYDCTISISCKNILDNMDLLDESKKSIIPSNGVILSKTSVEFKKGDTVFDVLKSITQKKKIHLEYTYTPLYGSMYIEGINNIYEFDCGELSGWKYFVNGEFQSISCSEYKVSDGDSISWEYVCEY